MRVNIHRGTKQIGGTCIEVESGGKRILLDLGLPLDSDEPGKSDLPAIDGITEGDPNMLGIIISHPHQDHYGLTYLAHKSIPIIMGSVAKRIIEAAKQFREGATPETTDDTPTLQNLEPVALDPFTITPYLVDHSAYDAYSILVEAEGKRLFYSGDFRAHGRKAALFDRLVSDPPKNIDLLLMEGSTIGRLAEGKSFPTESDLEEEFVHGFKETKGMAMVYTSSQNIDRIVTIYRACKKTSRTLVLDLYTAAILESLENGNIPQGTWPDVKILVPEFQRRQIKSNKLFALLDRFKPHRIFIDDLKCIKNRAVYIFRPSMMKDLDRSDCLDDARMFYSIWSGYLKDEGHEVFLKWLKEWQIPMQQIHTSGHASIDDLRQLSDALAPKSLVPVHSFEPEKYLDLFSNVTLKDDGQWWEV